MADMLQSVLTRFIKTGKLTLIMPNGDRSVFGNGDGEANSDLIVRLKGWATPLKLAAWPDLYLGEAYMNGSLILERGDIWDLLALCARNWPRRTVGDDSVLRYLLERLAGYLQQRNTRWASRRHVAHHYDLSRQLFDAFLDQDLQYSCAYFSSASLSLDQAQCAKKQLLASKLLLKPGQRVLDIGSGWGGLALTLAELEDVEVLGITLSEEQLHTARERARKRGLARRVSFTLCDYRDLTGKFDRIISVGMFEHVGVPNYRTFFAKLHDLLAEDGVAVVHSIGRMRGPSVTSAWVRKYIFPGGYIPALSEVCPVIENSGLWLTDLEILRLHYAETLREWRRRFVAQRDRILQLYDARFCRMWEFYLAFSEAAFRYGGLMVFQAQLARNVSAVPLTRDYMQRKQAITAAAAAE
jgi:cyclopropane-fatty-acyl-phospholipid synthase